MEDLYNYLLTTLTSLETLPNVSINPILTDLKQIVINSMKCDSDIKLELLNKRFTEFQGGFVKTKQYTTKQIRRLIHAINGELILLKKWVPSTQTSDKICTILTKQSIPIQPLASDVVPPTLRHIIENTIAQLSCNVMDSTITSIITQMNEETYAFLTDDELIGAQSSIENIMVVLRDMVGQELIFIHHPTKIY